MTPRDPKMQDFDHVVSLAEVRRKIANENSIWHRIRWRNVATLTAIFAALAFFWICFGRGLWEFIT